MNPLLSPIPAPQFQEKTSTNNVRLISLGAAVPPLRLSQSDALIFCLENFPVKDSTKAFYRRVFQNPSVQNRHFALDRLEEVLETDHDKIIARFEQWSTRLGAEALEKALANAGIHSGELDFLAVTTCTGYICPGITSYLVEKLGLRPDLRSVDIVGMGCGAAIPALEQAHNFLSAHPEGTAAVVSVEICSAAMYSDDDADLVISNALFGDGAAAAIFKAAPNASNNPPGRSSPSPIIDSFYSITLPAWRDTLRFKTQNGHLRNVLGKNVPQQAAEAMEQLVSRILSEKRLTQADIGHWIFHAGGEKILDAIQRRLALGPDALRASRTVLRDFGNLSSPTVLFVLAEEMRRPPTTGEWGLIASFGAGFSAHSALLRF